MKNCKDCTEFSCGFSGADRISKHCGEVENSQIIYMHSMNEFHKRAIQSGYKKEKYGQWINHIYKMEFGGDVHMIVCSNCYEDTDF